MSAQEKVAEAVFTIFAYLSIGALLLVVGGYAASVCWNMFAPDVLGLPSATLRNGIGLIGFLMSCGALSLKFTRGE